MSTTRKTRCTDCGEAVPYGRLSCPSCGTLLASVAGGIRATPTPAASSTTPIDAVAPVTAAPDPAPTAVSAETAGAAPPTLRPRPVKPTPPRPAAQRAAASLTLVPTTVVRSIAMGGYIPATAGATAGAPAGGWNAHIDAGRARAADDMASAAGPAPEAGDAPARSGLGLPAAPSLPHVSLDHARLDAGLEWAAALGGGIVAVAMLLPWSRSVIGSDGIGYLDSWGLAGPGHILVFVAALAVVTLAVLPTGVPTWISRGLAPLILGVFALGLTWPYAIGPLGAQVGVMLTFIGSIVLIVTGVVADWHTRHAPEEPPV